MSGKIRKIFKLSKLKIIDIKNINITKKNKWIIIICGKVKSVNKYKKIKLFYKFSINRLEIIKLSL